MTTLKGKKINTSAFRQAVGNSDHDRLHGFPYSAAMLATEPFAGKTVEPKNVMLRFNVECDGKEGMHSAITQMVKAIRETENRMKAELGLADTFMTDKNSISCRYAGNNTAEVRMNGIGLCDENGPIVMEALNPDNVSYMSPLKKNAILSEMSELLPEQDAKKAKEAADMFNERSEWLYEKGPFRYKEGDDCAVVTVIGCGDAGNAKRVESVLNTTEAYHSMKESLCGYFDRTIMEGPAQGFFAVRKGDMVYAATSGYGGPNKGEFAAYFENQVSEMLDTAIGNDDKSFWNKTDMHTKSYKDVSVPEYKEVIDMARRISAFNMAEHLEKRLNESGINAGQPLPADFLEKHPEIEAALPENTDLPRAVVYSIENYLKDVKKDYAIDPDGGNGGNSGAAVALELDDSLVNETQEEAGMQPEM